MSTRLRGYLADWFSFEALFVAFLYSYLLKSIDPFVHLEVDLTLVLIVSGGIAMIVIFIRDGIVLHRVQIFMLVGFGLFAGFAALSFLWSESSIYASEKLLRIFSVVLWAMAGPLLVINRSGERFHRLLRLIAVGGVVLIGYFLYHAVAHGGEVHVGTASYLTASRWIGMTGLIFVYWAAVNTQWSRQLVLISGAAVSTVAILVGGSRAAVLALVPAILVFFALNIELEHRTPVVSDPVKRLVAVSGVGVSGMLVTIYLVGGVLFGLQRLLIVFRDPTESTGVVSRLEYAESAITLWESHPLIGGGIGSFAPHHTGEDARAYPHNIILEIGAELGLIGIALLLGISIIAFGHLVGLRHRLDRRLFAFIFANVVFWFTGALFSFDLPANRYLFTAIGMCGVLFVSLEHSGLNVTTVDITHREDIQRLISRFTG